MVVFVGLIVPLPYRMKRKLFTFISESPIVAKIQYGMKVRAQGTPVGCLELTKEPRRSHSSSFSSSSSTASTGYTESKLSLQPIQRMVVAQGKLLDQTTPFLAPSSCWCSRTSLIHLTLKSQSRRPRIGTYGGPGSEILFSAKHVPLRFYFVPLSHSQSDLCHDSQRASPRGEGQNV